MTDHMLDQFIQTQGMESLLPPEEKPKKRVVPLEKLLASVQRLGEQKGATLYNILFRNAGWGVQYFEESRVSPEVRANPQHPRWADGLVVYAYKPTLRAALQSERERLKLLPDSPKSR